jgi:hypothetical protein
MGRTWKAPEPSPTPEAGLPAEGPGEGPPSSSRASVQARREGASSAEVCAFGPAGALAGACGGAGLAGAGAYASRRPGRGRASRGRRGPGRRHGRARSGWPRAGPRRSAGPGHTAASSARRTRTRCTVAGARATPVQAPEAGGKPSGPVTGRPPHLDSWLSSDSRPCKWLRTTARSAAPADVRHGNEKGESVQAKVVCRR